MAALPSGMYVTGGQGGGGNFYPAGSERPAKRSCIDCHQSAKSVSNRRFLDCTEPLCCIKVREYAAAAGRSARTLSTWLCSLGAVLTRAVPRRSLCEFSLLGVAVGQGENIPPGAEGQYPVNRFCERCLVLNYNWTESVWQDGAFVCPPCKGLGKPKRCALRKACPCSPAADTSCLQLAEALSGCVCAGLGRLERKNLPLPLPLRDV